MALVWLISTSVPPVFKAVTPSAPNVRKKMGPCVVLMAFSMGAVVISGKRPANKGKLLVWLTEANVLVSNGSFEMDLRCQQLCHFTRIFNSYSSRTRRI